MPEITLAEGTVPYRVVGTAESAHPTVVFVHGVLADDRLWDQVAEQLVERGYRAILPTLPLGSHTVAMRAPLSPQVVARMVHDLLVELDLSDVTLVGCDTGGALCQFIIDAHPDRIGRLVLTNCDAFEQFPPAPFRQVFALMRGPRTMRPLLNGMRSRRLRHSALGYGMLSRRADPALTRSWIEPARTSSAICGDIAGLLRAIDPADLVDVGDRLPRFAKPVAVLWGQDDRAFTPTLGKRLAERFPDSTYIPVPGARTFVALDDPDAVSSAIESISIRSADRQG